jgi:hypothetical protein
VHAINKTPMFLRKAAVAGMTDVELDAVEDYIARNPQEGVVMPGTGGCRKVRVATQGKGKSGGYRLITYYAGDDVPVFLLNVYAKSDKGNLSKAECNALRQLTAQLADAYR